MFHNTAHRTEQLQAWLEDSRVASICLARPLNAVVARINDQPLAAGIVRRWAVVPSYRKQAITTLGPILNTIDGNGWSGLVICALDRDDRIRSPLVWCGAWPDPAACVIARKHP